jgi:hypothetical protein
VKGKPAEDDPIKTRLGNDWCNIDESYNGVFELITVDGFATSSELSDSHRCEENFFSRELLMIDIDGGMTLEELFIHPFYKKFGAGYYTTPSHTDQEPRFRILFRAEEPITDSENYKWMMSGLMSIFKCADTICGDPTRVYFGTVNCPNKEIRDKVLSMKAIQKLIDIGKQLAPAVSIRNYSHSAVDPVIIALLCKIPIIPYADWYRIAKGLKDGGYSQEDFVQVSVMTRGTNGPRTEDEAITRWKDSKSTKKATMGSVIKFIQANLGEDCFKMAFDNFYKEKYGKFY